MLQSGLTPLHLTAQEDMVNAAEVLAKHDANLDQQTKVQTNTHICMCTQIINKTFYSFLEVETPLKIKNMFNYVVNP